MNTSEVTGVMPSLCIQHAGESPGIEAAEADRRTLSTVGIPGAQTVLDSGALSTLLDREVVIVHVRIKTGRSVVVAHRDAEGHDGSVQRCFGGPAAGWGWTWLSADADKYAKTLIRAEQIGERLSVHRDSAPYLVSGSVWSDRVLAKELAEAHAALGPEASWEIIRYNPHRRLVAVVTRDDGRRRPRRHVVRIAGESLRPLMGAVDRWRTLGAPVTTLRPVGGRGTAALAPLWGVGDLLAHPHPPAARSAGAVIAGVHSRGAAAPAVTAAEESEEHTPGALLAPVPHTAAEAVGETAPWLARRAAALAENLSARLDAPAEPTQLHGDLSPDQVLMADSASHKIRIIDLDRCGIGPAMRDVGSWIAACRHTQLPELGDAFMTGYLSAADVDHRAMHSWEAYAHLSAALDGFRRREPDWSAGLARRIELAEQAMLR